MNTGDDTGTLSGTRLALLNGTYQSLANVYYLAIRGVYIVLFARLLGVELYGQYVYSQSWYILALSVAAWGMNELASAEYARLKPEDRSDLLASGFGLRLLLSFGMALLVVAAALLFEPDAKLRLLMIIYAQGVLVRGATNWLSTLFVARENSKYWLYLTIPFLTLEVLLAVLLVWLDAGLVAIALAQCAVWWLLLFSTWYLYWRKFERLWPRLGRRYVVFFLKNGPTLALAAFALTFMGPGLLIAYRYLVDNPEQLGEAALATQLLVVLGQAIKTVSNAALPQLNRPVFNRHERQAFFARTVWTQSLYVGGALFLLSYLILPLLVIALVGQQFAEVAQVMAGFTWMLMPMLIIYGLRLLLISNRLLRGFLMATLLGLLLLFLQLFYLASLETVKVEDLLWALGVAYCGTAGFILMLLQRRLGFFSAADLLVAPLILSVCVLSFFALLAFSPLLAGICGVLPLLVASIRALGVSLGKIAG
jgi:O-antigen/teichoic acid export membrane protein